MKTCKVCQESKPEEAFEKCYDTANWGIGKSWRLGTCRACRYQQKTVTPEQRQKHNEYQREYWDRHKDRINARRREIYARKKEKAWTSQ